MKSILISASDPGGANALFPLIPELKKSRYRLTIVLSREAKTVFKEHNVKFIDGDRLSTRSLNKILMPDYCVYLFGSSIGDNLEKKILVLMKQKGVRSVCLLDYWIYYQPRFSKYSKDFYYLPDFILVMDQRARKEMIAEGFNPNKLVVTGNPYFEYFLAKIHRSPPESQTILFISQPFSAMPNYYKNLNRGYDEFAVLKDLLASLKDHTGYKLKIRLHPKEKKSKYNKHLRSKDVSIDKDTLEKSISDAGLVVGMTSIVLFLAAIAGKRVVSYQPKLKTKYRHDTNAKIVGQLITSKLDLELYLTTYFKYTHATFKPSDGNNYMVKVNATKNVIKYISKLTK